MSSARGLLNLVAAACVLTFIVVAGSALATRGTSPAELAGAAVVDGQSIAPTTLLYDVPKVAYSVTLARRAQGLALPGRRHHLRRVHLHVSPPKASLDFVLSSFNVLGASHTARGGRGGRYASGRVRMHYVAALLAEHDVDVVGFQELQSVQLEEFLRLRGGSFSVYPGFQIGRRGIENSIAWRSDLWEPVTERTIAIPYFDGHARPMPFVLLKSRQTGLEAWFANFHNPASVPPYGNQQRWRNVATAREVALANTLLRDGGNHPVFFTGDMNERASYFCRFTAGTPMIAAHGGSHVGGCQPPPARAVDWIFGSPGVSFSDYNEDRSALDGRTTDHPVITTVAHIGATPLTR